MRSTNGSVPRWRRRSGRFDGGSSIGNGVALRKGGEPPAVSGALIGSIVAEAENLQAARALLGGNPTFEAGGTVEIRELIED